MELKVTIGAPGLPLIEVTSEGLQIGDKYEGPLIEWKDYHRFIEMLNAAYEAGSKLGLCPSECQ